MNKIKELSWFINSLYENAILNYNLREFLNAIGQRTILSMMPIFSERIQERTIDQFVNNVETNNILKLKPFPFRLKHLDPVRIVEDKQELDREYHFMKSMEEFLGYPNRVLVLVDLKANNRAILNSMEPMLDQIRGKNKMEKPLKKTGENLIKQIVKYKVIQYMDIHYYCNFIGEKISYEQIGNLLHYDAETVRKTIANYAKMVHSTSFESILNLTIMEYDEKTKIRDILDKVN